MNAQPLLARIAEGLMHVRLETVLIGNAAAALNGAPVTTLDFDFMVRDTERSLVKIRALAEDLGAVVVPPRPPLSKVYSVIAEERGLFIDFLDTVVGVKSFASLRSRATAVSFGSAEILVASLEDVLASKRAADRAKDRAVLDIIEATLAEINAQGDEQ